MADTPNSNGRITLAVLKRDIEHLSQEVADSRREMSEFRKELRDWQTSCISRVGSLERHQEGSLTRWQAHMDQHDRDWQAHGEKHATERGVLGALQFIGTAIASAIGVFVPKP